MFRSGTTLVSRMFHSHPEIACASDPYAPLFKMFRNQFSVKSENLPVNFESPHDDYYYYDSKVSFFHGLQKETLEMDCDNIEWDVFLDQISHSLRPYSPLLIPYLNKLPGSNFKETFVNGIDIIRQAYGDNKTKIVGFKDVWTSEFGVHIARDIPNSKVLHIVRDPRSVCASNLASSEPYPLIFLARQWRKACASALYQKKLFKNEDKIFILRYEDLILYPDIYIPKICDFLEIDPHDNMYKPSTFLDGSNQPWIQNSSYNNPISGFNIESMHKWKEILSDKQIAMIEFMCFGEMELLEYEKYHDPPLFLTDIILNPPEINQSSVASWLRPFVDQGRESLIKELSLEFVRFNSLTNGKKCDDKVAEKFGLWSESFKIMQENLNSKIL